MKVEIWSDVVCPFCYIGKRRFEQGLEGFAHKELVEIVWRSFQLDPGMKNTPGQSLHQYLAERKGFSLESAKKMNDQVSGMAKEVGLEYNLDNAIVANTFDAHRLLHLAAQHGLGNAAEERLFRAYFTEGRNIEDQETLVQLAAEIGLDAAVVNEALAGDAYTQNVKADQIEAQQVGVSGVPFFVFNQKYAVSGAQPAAVFKDVMNKVWEEEHPAASESAEGGVCTPDGVCR